MLFFTERKASKELQASGLTVCAAGSGSVAAIKDGIHARSARVIRQSPPVSWVSFRRALTRRAPCACGRGLSSGSCFPHGEVALQCEALHCDTIDFSTMLSKGIDRFPVYTGGLCEHCNTFRAVGIASQQKFGSLRR